MAAVLIAAGTWIGSAVAGEFYVRAGAVTAVTDLDCSSVSPAALYGCARGGDGTPYRSVGDFGMVPVIEVGLGYAAAPVVRLEVLAEYRPRFAFEGRASFLETGRRQSAVVDLSSLSARLAAYVDLTGLGGWLSRTLRRGRCRRRAQPDRRNPHDLSEDDDNRAGREPEQCRLDGDGRVRGAVDRTHDARSRVALHGPWRDSHRARRGWRGLARREPRAVSARSRSNAGETEESRAEAFATVRVLRRSALMAIDGVVLAMTSGR